MQLKKIVGSKEDRFFFFCVRSVREIIKKKVQYNNIKKRAEERLIYCEHALLESNRHSIRGFQIRSIENIHKKNSSYLVT